MSRGDAEQGAEGGMSVAAAVEAKDELIEIALDVFAAQAVIGAERPAFEIGEDAVGPGQHDRGSHSADNMRIVGDIGSAAISGPPSVLAVVPGTRLALRKGYKLSAE